MTRSTMTRSITMRTLACVLVGLPGCRIEESDEPPLRFVRVKGILIDADGVVQPGTNFVLMARAPTCKDERLTRGAFITDERGRIDAGFPPPGDRFDGCLEAQVETANGSAVVRFENVGARAMPTDSIWIEVRLP